MGRFWLFFLIIIAPTTVHAQENVNAPCGMVEAVGYPLDSVQTVTVATGYDDFGLYRSRFNGNHTGLDVGFRERGTPVRAIARGEVTFSDVTAWGQERGVVIVAHTLPNNQRVLSVYGHMEETLEWTFPDVGTCVEMGDPVGAVGWPASSAPHLHYEVRGFGTGSGGNGYVTEDPLELGWQHPLDFTQLWQMRFSPGFVEAATSPIVPTLPPQRLPNGWIAIASNDTVAAITQEGEPVWRILMDSIITGIDTLSDGRVVARSRSGQTMVLQNGRFVGFWILEGPYMPFVRLEGDRLVFVTTSGALEAHATDGTVLWQIPPPPNFDEVTYFDGSGTTLLYAVEQAEGYTVNIVNLNGATIFSESFSEAPQAAPSGDGGWRLWVDGEILSVGEDGTSTRTAVDAAPGLMARLAADTHGSTYFFIGDADYTLIAWNADGSERWRTTYTPSTEMLLRPLLVADAGCAVYLLDEDGYLTAFDAQTGAVAAQTGLYPGGAQTGRPGARMLEIESTGVVRFGAGFLSSATVDVIQLAQGALDHCRVE